MAKVPADAVAIVLVLVTPASFAGNKIRHSVAGVTVVSSFEAKNVCLCVPTYNEAADLEPLVSAALNEFDRLGLSGTVLIIDDGSPDGTGELADDLARAESRLHVLHQGGRSGLGCAYQAGFAWSLERNAEFIVQMDCDFSHDPTHLGSLVEAAQHADLVLGSRYVDGGQVVGWPLTRRLISRGGCWYARTLLDLPIRDPTGGFKCWRRETLERLPYDRAAAKGYGFQIEMTYRAVRAGFRVAEVPITFSDRAAGESKMTLAIATEAAGLVLTLRREDGSEPADTEPAQLPGRARTPRIHHRPAGWVTTIAARARRATALPLHAVGLFFVAGAFLTLLAVVQTPADLGYELLVLVFLVITAIGTMTLFLMLNAWRTADVLRATSFPGSKRGAAHSFSLIVPARHEERVLEATLTRLSEQQHPDFEVIVVVGHDDPGTKVLAEAVAQGDPRFRIVVDTDQRKTKPKALNAALPLSRGDVVGVFDAEDQVAPGLLLAVDEALQETGADIVQGATQLMNFQSNWFSVRNALEYYFWFRSRLHLHAAVGYIPLGGNTVFIRREWIERAGGWDVDCLAEDCDLGTRLSALGARTVVAYSPDLVTREETPPTLAALVRQRTRWNQGFLQVLKKRDWRRLPLRPRLLAGFTLSFPFVQAVNGLLLPLAIGAVVLFKLPTPLALLSFLPVVPLVTILVAELVALAEFGRDFGLRPRLRDYTRLTLGAIPYQLLLSVAAVRAVQREIRGLRTWEKTAHVGAHLHEAR
jgi:cellulose synthase/poly-beta-1,6-N-acetylglucosamine synthase-like glycosyltransferase